MRRRRNRETTRHMGNNMERLIGDILKVRMIQEFLGFLTAGVVVALIVRWKGDEWAMELAQRMPEALEMPILRAGLGVWKVSPLVVVLLALVLWMWVCVLPKVNGRHWG